MIPRGCPCEPMSTPNSRAIRMSSGRKRWLRRMWRVRPHEVKRQEPLPSAKLTQLWKMVHLVCGFPTQHGDFRLTKKLGGGPKMVI